MKRGLHLVGFLSREDVDDDFDHNTAASVELFQESAGLKVTGKFDEITKDALIHALARRG